MPIFIYYLAISSDSNLNTVIDTVRRYLLRKPMTSKDIIQKLNSKVPIPKDKMVTLIAQALKRLNPQKKKIKDKLYLYLENSK